jgi:predicted CDP-diglyceride synthetase/phosphatidate cytidylyltransferase
VVRSDGNGSMIVDKNLWRAAVAVIAILLSVIGFFGTMAMSDIKEARDAINVDAVAGAMREARIGTLEKQLDRIETKIDRLSAKTTKQ